MTVIQQYETEAEALRKRNDEAESILAELWGTREPLVNMFGLSTGRHSLYVDEDTARRIVALLGIA